jgi:hypothetical protein
MFKRKKIKGVISVSAISMMTAVILFLGILAPPVVAQSIGGLLKNAVSEVKEAGGDGPSVDVDALVKKINSDLRAAENLKFNGKIQESSDMLDQIARDIATVKGADPDNSKLAGYESKYARQRKDIDKRMPKETPPLESTSTSSVPASQAGPTSEKVPAGVTKRLKEIGGELDDAEGMVSNTSYSEDRRVKNTEYALKSADELMGEIERMYADSMSHPDVVSVQERRKKIQGDLDALKGKVADAEAAEEANRKAEEDAAAAEEANKEADRAAWESRTIDKKQAAEDWALLAKLRDKHLRDLGSESYFTKAGEGFIPVWREWKSQFAPLQVRFKQTYGESYDDVTKSFEGVQKPLDVSSEITDLSNWLGYLDLERQEKDYVDWAVRRGRDSYSRWKAMENPDPTKYELKFDYTERALNSFKIARMLDPEGSYDDFIAQAEAARKETYPLWMEVLKKLEWPGHKADFAGPGKPDALAKAALDFLKKDKDWSKPEYDDVHIPLAACVTGSGWVVSKTNVLQQPTQYSIDIFVAFEGSKEPEIVYVYHMVFYTREELGVKKELPFKWCNSRLYAKYRMLKSKVPR